MQVETFECTEIASEPIEATEEALALIESLGLAGQQELVCPSPKHDGKDRCPYRQIHAEEFFTYKILCHHEYKLAEYAQSPIPLRVLQIAAHAQSLGMFDEIVVWDKGKAVEKDPVLIGHVFKDGKSWNKTRYILARWGEELETFAVLLNRAIEQKRSEIVSQLKDVAAKATAGIARVESMPVGELMKASPDDKVSMSAPYQWSLT